VEFNTGAMEGTFAATPPLEATRAIISLLATDGVGGVDKGLMVCDVSTAIFCAPCTRRIFLELPDEDKEEGKDEVAEMLFSPFVGIMMHRRSGTRDAASI